MKNWGWVYVIPLLLMSLMLKVWGAEGPWTVRENKLGYTSVELDGQHFSYDWDCTNGPIAARCKSAQEDFVDAMNEAHERRTKAVHYANDPTLTFPTTAGEHADRPANAPGTYNPCEDGTCQ